MEIRKLRNMGNTEQKKVIEQDFERELLSNLLQEGRSLYEELKEYLTPNPFIKETHRRIFEAIKELAKSDSPIEWKTVALYLTEEDKGKDRAENWRNVVMEVGMESAARLLGELRNHASILQEGYLQHQIEELAKELREGGDPDIIIPKLTTLSNRPSIRYKEALEDDIDEIFDSYNTPDKAIDTNIVLAYKTQDAYRFNLPSGAITIIGAPTNHGKSKALMSLALDAMENGEEGEIIYITYEENKRSVIKQLLNAYADIEVTRAYVGKSKTGKFAEPKHGNIQTLTEYLQNGDASHIQADKKDRLDRAIYGFKKAYREGLIKVLKPESNYLSELIGLLRYASSKRKIKAVFIDYVQELYIESYKSGARTDELKEIMIQIDLIAQEYDYPIVMAAQLRRETESPLSMTNQDIADSGWIERKASEILLLWSSKEKCKKDPDGKKTAEANKEIKWGFKLGDLGKVYVKLTKSRISRTGIDAVLDINGNTGRIHGNEPIKVEQKKADL